MFYNWELFLSVSNCQVIIWYSLKLQTIISNSLKSAHSWSVFQVMSLHIEASYSLNIQAMMFQRYCQTPLFSQNTRMLCLRIVYTAYHAMGNKQKRNNSAFTVQLVKLEPKEGSRKVSRTICAVVIWIPGVVTSFMLFFQQGDCQTPLHPVKLEWT